MATSISKTSGTVIQGEPAGIEWGLESGNKDANDSAHITLPTPAPIVDFRPNSLSSSLMMGINLYRNKPGIFNKAQAQIAFPIVTVAAIVESVVASIFTILSTLILPFTSNCFTNSIELLKSSSFTIIWSLVDFLINPFCHTVVADEESAKFIAQTGNLMILPHNAIV